MVKKVGRVVMFAFIVPLLLAVVGIALVTLIFMVLIKTNKLLDYKIKNYIKDKKP